MTSSKLAFLPTYWPGTASISRTNILPAMGKILTKTSILMQNCIEDNMIFCQTTEFLPRGNHILVKYSPVKLLFFYIHHLLTHDPRCHKQEEEYYCRTKWYSLQHSKRKHIGDF